MSKIFVDKMSHEVYERDAEFDRTLSDFVNGGVCSMKETAEMMAKDHRYLLSEKFKLFMYFVEELANNCEKGFYDGRNEWACKASKEIIDNLVEKKLYFKHTEY